MLILLIILSAVLLGGLFLSPYFAEPQPTPVGFDTPDYIWRANLVWEQGLNALPGSAPGWFKDRADRPGYPVLAALVQATTSITPLQLAFALPAVMGILIGVGAGIFSRRCLDEPLWAFPVYAVVVGASVNVSITAPGLAANLLVDGLVMAAATTAVLAAGGNRTVVATLLLMAGAVLIHWPFAVLFVIVLGALAAALAPESFRAWRSGQPLLSTPAGRLGTVVAGSGVVMAGAIILSPALPVPPRAGPGSLVRKARRLMPLYRIPLIWPAAAAGSVALFFPPHPARRRGLLLMLIWAASAVVAVILLVLGARLATHRFLGFALGIPVLGAAALTAVGRLLARNRPLAAIAALVVTAGAVASVVAAESAWSRTATNWISEEQLAQAGLAGEYLERVGTERPVIFVVNPYARNPGTPVALSFRILRAGLPGDQVARTFVYLGRPRTLLAGRPTLREGNARYNRASLLHWSGVEPVVDEEPIILLLPAFNHGLPENERVGRGLAPGLIIVAGPIPANWQPAPLEPLDAPSAMSLIVWVVSILAVLTVVGLGWSASLIPLSWPDRVSLAPALGIAVLAVGGVIAGRLTSGGFAGLGVIVAALVSLLGWFPALRARSRSPL